MRISVTINDARVITGWATHGGIGGAIDIDVDVVPNELAAGWYTLSEPPVDDEGLPLEPYKIAYDLERHRAIESQRVPVPPDLCKPWFDLDAMAWIETATSEELEDWVPPAPPEPLPDKVARLEQETVTTMLAVTEAYETSLQHSTERELETVTAMIGLAEVYELIISQQSLIDSLTARIVMLEGGEG